MRLFKKTHIPFVKIRKTTYIISLLIIILGIVGLVTKGLNWSIDFTSGVAMELDLSPVETGTKPLQIETLRNILINNGYKEAEIQRVGEADNSHFLIKTKGSATGTGNEIIRLLIDKLPEYTQGKDINNQLVLQIDEVGPKIGKELRSQAIMAILIALVLMIIYIWIRFELTFGIAAILALFHDVFCIVGIFALMGKEITIQIIAALLTIVGYSINDTIVIYDRIREDLRVYRKEPYEIIFNNAMNRTLSRTTITAGTTLLTALSLYFFGGTVIHDFALAISLGIIFGTYSSIFVASNVVIDYYHVFHQEKASLQTLTSKVKKK